MTFWWFKVVSCFVDPVVDKTIVALLLGTGHYTMTDSILRLRPSEICLTVWSSSDPIRSGLLHSIRPSWTPRGDTSKPRRLKWPYGRRLPATSSSGHYSHVSDISVPVQSVPYRQCRLPIRNTENKMMIAYGKKHRPAVHHCVYHAAPIDGAPAGRGVARDCQVHYIDPLLCR